MNESDALIVTDYLEKVKEDLISEQSSQGIRNTGESARSLKVIKSGFSETPILTGSRYWRFLLKGFGRGPGRFPNIDNIKDWILTKPLDLGDRTLNQVAFLVGRKIAFQGTDIYQNKKGIHLEAIEKKHITKFIKRLAQNKASRYTDLLRNSVR